MKKLLNNKWATVCCLPYGKLLLLVTDNVLDHDCWNNVDDSSMFNNWLSNNSEENKQLCAYPFSSPSDLENGADDIMNQAHAFVAVFEQDSGRSTNTRYLSVLSGSLLLESDFGSAEAKRRR